MIKINGTMYELSSNFNLEGEKYKKADIYKDPDAHAHVLQALMEISNQKILKEVKVEVVEVKIQAPAKAQTTANSKAGKTTKPAAKTEKPKAETQVKTPVPETQVLEDVLVENNPQIHHGADTTDPAQE